MVLFYKAICFMSCLVFFLGFFLWVFSVLLALRLPHLEKRELVLVLFVGLFFAYAGKQLHLQWLSINHWHKFVHMLVNRTVFFMETGISREKAKQTGPSEHNNKTINRTKHTKKPCSEHPQGRAKNEHQNRPLRTVSGKSYLVLNRLYWHTLSFSEVQML